MKTKWFSSNRTLRYRINHTETWNFNAPTLVTSVSHKITAKCGILCPKTLLLTEKQLHAHTFLCSDSQCLPPGDPRILCPKHGYPITGKSFKWEPWSRGTIFIAVSPPYSRKTLLRSIEGCIEKTGRLNMLESEWFLLTSYSVPLTSVITLATLVLTTVIVFRLFSKRQVNDFEN